ncbi:testis-specific gene 10 protein-like [Amblyraja radiata]|uniref:testis-specific gene 10 protein-like n=1 Tax=Amblyraja radiata TaxID=386614 RepID=UPI001401DE9D|nr:testis-specific gene 10 protein-like [Amblyraja radiata]
MLPLRLPPPSKLPLLLRLPSPPLLRLPQPRQTSPSGFTSIPWEACEASLANRCTFRSVAPLFDLTEQLAQYEQLVVQLQNDIQDKETQLHVRDEQLKVLEDLKEKLREKDEALLETTQHVDVLQRKLDEKNREIAELVEDLRKLEDENENLDNKLLAEDYATHIKVRDLKESHKADLTNLKEQATGSLNKFTEWKINELEEQVRLLNQEAERLEDRSLSIEASFQSKIQQIQEELDNVQLVSAQKLLLEHKDVAIDYEGEDDQLHLNVNWPQCVEAQNDLISELPELEEEVGDLQRQDRFKDGQSRPQLAKTLCFAKVE